MIVSVTADRQLSLPPEAQINFEPGDHYEMVIKNEGILFMRIADNDQFRLEESAQLYAELYSEDDDLQALKSSRLNKEHRFPYI
jgi:antitoxin component of MazEF toxin-antitoxin module